MDQLGLICAILGSADAKRYENRQIRFPIPSAVADPPPLDPEIFPGYLRFTLVHPVPDNTESLYPQLFAIPMLFKQFKSLKTSGVGKCVGLATRPNVV